MTNQESTALSAAQQEKNQARLNKLNKRLRHAVGQAITDYNMIEQGDRIMVCLSGGKDSYTLLDILLNLQKYAPVDFEIVAVNLDQQQPGFPKEVLPNYLSSLGIKYRIINEDTYSVVKRVIEEGKTTCSLCSRLRRGILYRVAQEERCTKIALGHHRDDMIETLFLNMFFAGKMKSMPAKLVSDNGLHTVIRPLAYCREKDIEKYAQLREFPIIPCNLCGSQPNLQRQAIKQMLQAWDKQHPGRIETIFKAMQDISLSHLQDLRHYDFVNIQSSSEREFRGTSSSQRVNILAGTPHKERGAVTTSEVTPYSAQEVAPQADVAQSHASESVGNYTSSTAAKSTTAMSDEQLRLEAGSLGITLGTHTDFAQVSVQASNLVAKTKVTALAAELPEQPQMMRHQVDEGAKLISSSNGFVKASFGYSFSTGQVGQHIGHVDSHMLCLTDENLQPAPAIPVTATVSQVANASPTPTDLSGTVSANVNVTPLKGFVGAPNAGMPAAGTTMDSAQHKAPTPTSMVKTPAELDVTKYATSVGCADNLDELDQLAAEELFGTTDYQALELLQQERSQYDDLDIDESQQITQLKIKQL